MGRKLTQAGLVTVMVLGGLMLWFGNPVIWLWIGSQMSETQRASMGPYAVVAIGIIVSTILVSLGTGARPSPLPGGERPHSRRSGCGCRGCAACAGTRTPGPR